ncbi:MAG: flagellin [Lachnospiraceae bacterium]|nr:flagellin [Lachnospiraceae bacterium]
MLAVAFNYAATNARRQYGITTDRQKKNVEKLSSGFRINRAADDAAGLSISEKMRKQVRGLSRGTVNAQDGISLLQIADGSLAEMTAMMHRMTELSIQSANGTYSDDDRQAMQNEIKQLQMEINGEVDRTRFNDMKIFAEDTSLEETPKEPQLPDVKIGTVTGTPTDNAVSEYKFSADDTGITINGDTANKISWSSIIADDGTSIDSLKAGTYSFDYNGLTFPVTTPDVASVGDLANVLSTYTVTKESVPDYPVTQAVSSAEFSVSEASLSGISAGTAFSVNVTDSGINNTSWAEIDPGLDADGKLTSGSRQVDIDMGSGVRLGLTINQGATKDSIKKALSGMSVKVEEGKDLKIVDGSMNVAVENLKSGKYPSVMVRSNASMKRFDWSVADNPTGDTALKDIADSLGCDTDRLFNIRLLIDFSNQKNGNTSPIARLYAAGTDTDGNSLGESYVDYSMSDEDLAKLKSALSDGKPHSENDPVADATFTYKDSTFTAHLVATHDLTGANDSPDPLAILDPTQFPGYSVRVHAAVEHQKSLVTTGSLASMEDGNVTTTTYHDEYQASSTIPKKDENSYPRQSWWIQTGADTLSGMVVSVGSISLRLLGLDDMDISTEDGATNGITKAGKALDYVSRIRSSIGAQQNRLEHTIANNENATENTTASESRIRDADMADEMVEFHRNNILELVGESVIAQANSQQEDLLSLLGNS